MSGTLKKSPSEGDIASSLAADSAEETSSNTKDFFNKSNYHPPDFKRGFLANSGFRLVWKNSNQEDLSSLNKVLDLPQEPKRPRSTSPRLSQSIQLDHVFSEHFNPLAVHKRDTTDSKVQESEETKGVSNTENKNNTVERRKSRLDLGKLNMPSVKLLKSRFESPENKEEVTRKPRSFKRSHTLSGHEIGFLKLADSQNNGQVEKEENQNIAKTLTEKTNEKIEEINLTKKTHAKENIEQRNDIEIEGSVPVVKMPLVNIESGNIHKVKDLLAIFQKLEKTKILSPDLKENKNKNRIQEHQEIVKTVNINEKSKTETKIASDDKIPEKVSQINSLKSKQQETVRTVNISENSKTGTKIAANDKTHEKVSQTNNLKSKQQEAVRIVNISENSKTETKIATDDDIFENVSQINNLKSNKSEKIHEKREEKIEEEDNVEVPSLPSVFNLRQRWENLTSRNSKLETKNIEMKETIKFKPAKNDDVIKKETELSEEKKSFKLDLSIQTGSEVTRHSSEIKRNAKYTNSVKKIALNYEESKSAPNTPSSTKEMFDINITSALNPSQLSDGKVNDSKGSNLENMKKFSSESYLTQKTFVEVNQNTDDNIKRTVSETHKEISLGSLQRQASVKKMKEKYETKVSFSSSPSLYYSEIEKNRKQVKAVEFLETKVALENHREMSLGSLQRQSSVSKMKEKYDSEPQTQSSISSSKSDAEETTQNVISTENFEITPVAFESHKEMSLGSLQRQASVSKIKDKYELQPQTLTLPNSDETEKRTTSPEVLGTKRTIENYKEMSLGSLQRKASVSKMKEKYESQPETQRNTTNDSEETTQKVISSKVYESNKTFESHREISLSSLQRQASMSKMKEKYESQPQTQNMKNALEETTQQDTPTVVLESNRTFENQREISLGSLQRQASVSKLKDKYESQPQTQNMKNALEETTQQATPTVVLESHRTFENQREISLGSLQRQASVSKMKDKYESQSQSLSSLTNTKSSETEDSFKNKKNIKSTESIEKNIYLRNKKEMSLGSLERQASVTKMKEKYDLNAVTSISTSEKKSTITKEIKTNSNNISSTNVLETESKKITKNTKESDIKISTSTINKITQENITNSAKLESKSMEANTTSNNDNDNNQNKDDKAKRKSKIEELVESFMKSEGISKNIESQVDNFTSQSEIKSTDVTTSIQTKETNKFTDKHDKEISKENFSKERKLVTKELNKESSSSKAIKKSAKKQEPILRSGSRELKPDELKYFQSLPSMQDPYSSAQKRERSNSFDSSSASSTLSKEDLSRSKLRSSSRQYRDLHKDELKFFDSKINGTMSKISFRNSSELALRQEVLEKSVRSSFDNGERKE